MVRGAMALIREVRIRGVSPKISDDIGRLENKSSDEHHRTFH
jgi:hypothetical protein